MKKNSMKWVALFTFAALMMGACNGGGGDTAKLQSQVDSLRQADEQHKSELNDMVSFVDALTEGLDAISRRHCQASATVSRTSPTLYRLAAQKSASCKAW